MSGEISASGEIGVSGETGASGEISVSDEARDSTQYGWCSSSDYGVMTRSLVRCACVSGEA